MAMSMRSLVQSKGRGTGPKCFILRDDQLTVLFQENLDSDRPSLDEQVFAPVNGAVEVHPLARLNDELAPQGPLDGAVALGAVV